MENFSKQNFINIFRIVRLGIVIVIAFTAVIALLAGFRAMSVQASTVKVGLITAPGPLNDMGWNWSSYRGLLRAETEFGVVGTVYTSTDQSGIEPNVQKCAQEGNDLCIGLAYWTTGAISNTALIYPNTKFVNIDGWYANYPPNLRAVGFASQEVGYLAGTLAALMSQSNTIGAVCGMEVPVVTAFSEGYSNGAHCANPAVTTIITYTGTFVDPELGAQSAQDQIAQGADVVFGLGGSTGNGAILTATQSGVWAIGVDFDQYYTLFMSGTVPGSNYLLTSAMKRLDNAVYLTVSDVVSETFTSGIVWYGLGSGAMELAPFHEADASIPSGIRTQLDWVKRAIIGGAINPANPNGPCLVMHQQYLPFASR
jgi:basic membrane protein A